jgi:GT2 family glycosyltransferase
MPGSGRIMTASVEDRHDTVAVPTAQLQFGTIRPRPVFTPPAGPGLAWSDVRCVAAPYGDQVHCNQLAWTMPSQPAEIAIAIPIRDEAINLPRCLDALRNASREARRAVSFAFVVHDTADGSYDIAHAWMGENGFSGCAFDLTLDHAIRDAPHARRFALDCAALLAPEGLLFTTDADSSVGTDLFAQVFDLMRSGADLVCEDVRLFDCELDALHPQVRAVGDAERAYRQASVALWERWTGATDCPFLHPASGASLAIRAGVYRDLGGLPLPASGEDRALCDNAIRQGYTISTIPDGGTRTSARLDGRAKGGCSGALIERAATHDPCCDDRLVPVAELRRRARIAAEGKPSLINSEFWCGAGSRGEMRYSDVLAELDKARELLGTVHA